MSERENIEKQVEFFFQKSFLKRLVRTVLKIDLFERVFIKKSISKKFFFENIYHKGSQKRVFIKKVLGKKVLKKGVFFSTKKYFQKCIRKKGIQKGWQKMARKKGY